MKIARIAAIAMLSLSLAACGQVVDAGNVGVKIKNLGNNTGVQTEALGTGWQPKGLGEDIVEIPVTQKVYTFKGEEQIIFNDNTGLVLAGDTAVTVRIQGAKAPAVYEKYRMNTEELIHGPIRNAVRSAINAEAEKMTSEEIYTGGKTTLIANALHTVQKQYANSGIDILGLEWVGNVRYPESVTTAITLKTTKLQEAEAAKADEARAIAQAKAKVAEAEGDAEAMRVKGEALRTNPQILQQEWIAKWNGHLPSTVTGANTMMMVQPK